MSRVKLLDLNEILQQPGRKLDVEVTTSLAEYSDIEISGPLKGNLKAVSTGNQLLLTGMFQASCILDCARCSRPLETEVKLEFEEQFDVEGTPSHYGSGDFAHVVSEEIYPIFEKNALKIDELVHQLLLINLPLQPLCQYGWEGKCPEAQKRGLILEHERIHPEFEKLRNILGQNNEHKEDLKS